MTTGENPYFTARITAIGERLRRDGGVTGGAGVYGPDVQWLLDQLTAERSSRERAEGAKKLMAQDAVYFAKRRDQWQRAAEAICRVVLRLAWLKNNGKTSEFVDAERNLVQMAHDIRTAQHDFAHLEKDVPESVQSLAESSPLPEQTT